MIGNLPYIITGRDTGEKIAFLSQQSLVTQAEIHLSKKWNKCSLSNHFNNQICKYHTFMFENVTESFSLLSPEKYIFGTALNAMSFIFLLRCLSVKRLEMYDIWFKSQYYLLYTIYLYYIFILMVCELTCKALNISICKIPEYNSHSV